MPITHPALPQPQKWRLTLADGHAYVVDGKVNDVSAPVLCHHPSHGPDAELGVLQSIIRVERAG